MVNWAAVFFIIALLAALIGFGGIVVSAVAIIVAKVLFVVFIALAITALSWAQQEPY